MKNNHFVMVSPVFFNQLKQRHQAFAEELVKNGHSVLYLEPLLAGGFKMQAHKASDKLMICRISVPWRCTATPTLHSMMVRLALAILQKRCKIVTSRSILWLSEPSMAAFCKQPWKAVIYDRCDLHGSFPGQKEKPWLRYESEIFSHASLLIASHKRLLEDVPDCPDIRTELIGNACAESFILTHPVKKPPVPPLKVLSAGAHFEWIDMDWLNKFCSLDNVELHIAGNGRGKEFEKLVSQPSVVFHGKLNHKELAKLIHSCHVGLLPFRNIRLSEAVDPIKAYEYTAGGLAVWSPHWFNCDLTDKQVSTQDEIKSALASMIQSSRPMTLKKATATWSERIKTVLDRLADFSSD